MSVRFGVLLFFAVVCVSSAAAEPASVEAAHSSLQGPGFSPLFSSGSVMAPIPVPIGTGQPALAEPRRPVVVTTVEEDPQAEAAVGRDELRPMPRAGQPVIVVEAPRQVSFEGLRRDVYLHPEHGLTGRFLEMGTELPPLFGEDF